MKDVTLKTALPANSLAMIPEFILSNSVLSPNAKLLYGIFLAMGIDSAPSAEYLSKLIGVNKATIQRLIVELKDNNYLTRNIVYKNNFKDSNYRVIHLNISQEEEK